MTIFRSYGSKLVELGRVTYGTLFITQVSRLFACLAYISSAFKLAILLSS